MTGMRVCKPETGCRRHDHVYKSGTNQQSHTSQVDQDSRAPDLVHGYQRYY